MSTETAPDPLVGMRLGDYVIEALLGEGAMGRVYRARQVSLGRAVALKVMAQHLAAQEEMVARFRREARAAGAVSHPHLVQIYSFGEVEGACFFAMELVEGQSLRRYLERGEHFSEAECTEIARQTLAGLCEAHKAGVVHRDIKPDNLMLDSQGQIKVTDLGLARFAEFETNVTLTMTGVGFGTPLYVAPEQAESLHAADYRADFYSFGATLFHLATGRPAYDGATGIEVVSKHLMAPVPQARDANPELSPAFSELIARLMAKNPDHRPQSHAEIDKALDRCGAFLAEEMRRRSRISASQALRVVKPTIWDEPALWIAGAVAAVVIIGAGILYPRFSRGPEAAEVLGIGSPMADGRRPDAIGGRSPLAGDSAMNSSRVENAKAVGVGGSITTGIASNLAPTDLSSATRDRPFVNSLGMKFVPVPGTRVLFCMWETRVKDFEAFVRDSGYAWSEKCAFSQTSEDPVLRVSWADASAFCAWLSKKEGLEYRLPTDEEWDEAVGKGRYPWGDEWPPPVGAENICGEESRLGMPDDPGYGVVEGCRDAHPRTSPVGSYRATKVGLYDMGGNAREWVQDWWNEANYRRHLAGGGRELPPELSADRAMGNRRRVSRGGVWCFASPGNYVSSVRDPHLPYVRHNMTGFRCVVAVPPH